MFIVGILTVAQVVLIIFQASLLATAITNMFEGTAWRAVLPHFSGFAVIFVLRQFIVLLKERLSLQYAERTSFQQQNLLIRKIFELGPRGIGKKGSGNMITLVMEGIPKFRTYLELFIPRVISMTVIPIILLVYIFTWILFLELSWFVRCRFSLLF